MIEAIIHYQDSTLIMDLPRNIYDIHEKLMSIGCPTAPGRIPLTDNEDDALRVKLYGRIEMGNHLIRILSEQNTLADANALDALYCKNVPAGVRDYFNLRSGTPEPVQPKVKKPRAEKAAPAIVEGHENEQH